MSELLVGNLALTRSPALGSRLDRADHDGDGSFIRAAPRPVSPVTTPIGRQGELTRIREALLGGASVTVHAPCGFGVTSLLEWLADSARIGIDAEFVHLRVGQPTPADLLRQLVLQLFIADGRRLATDGQARLLLAPIEAVVVLDDVRVAAEVVDELRRVMPRSRFVLGGTERLSDDPEVHDLALQGLGSLAGGELLRSAAGRDLDARHVERLWELVYGGPLHLLQAGSLVRAGRHSLAELVDLLEREGDPSALDRVIVDGTGVAGRRALAVLALFAGAYLPTEWVAVVAGLADVRSAVDDLRAGGVARRNDGEVGLPVCVARQYAPSVLASLDAGQALKALVEAVRSGDMRDGLSLRTAENLLTLLGYAGEAGDLGSAVRLVKLCAPVLALVGQLDESREALERGLEAARQLGDGADLAWIEHELGTVLALQEQVGSAQAWLEAALRRREELGDVDGAGQSRHNLAVLAATAGGSAVTGRRRGVRLAGAVGAAVLVGVGLGLLGAQVAGGTPSGTAATPVTATVTPGGPTSSPPSPPRSPTTSNSGPTSSEPGTGPSTSIGTTSGPPTVQPSRPLQLAVPEPDLGAVDIAPGTAAGHTELTLTNPNRSPLPVSDVTSSDDAFTRVDGGSCSASVPGGGGCTLRVQFAPQRLGRHSTTLTVASAGVGQASVDLTGTGVAQLVVEVAPKGFGLRADDVTVSGVGNCGGGCTATISESPVTLRARPVPEPDGGNWVGVWQTPCSDQAGTCVLELSRDEKVVVNYGFVPPGGYLR